MSRSATKKAQPSKSTDKTQPMDNTIREVAVPVVAPNHQRACWAAKTLVSEVLESFPETPVEYSNYDGRNTALDVAFDLTVLDHPDDIDLRDLLTLLGDPAYNADPRIKEVISEDDQVLVSFRSNAQTQDSREPFGLLDALSVLSGRDEFDYGDNPEDDDLFTGTDYTEGAESA